MPSPDVTRQTELDLTQRARVHVVGIGGAGLGQNFRAREAQQVVQLFGRKDEAAIVD